MRRQLFAIAIAATVALALAACQPTKKKTPPPLVTQEFVCAEATEHFVVPDGVTGLVIEAFGAQGAQDRRTPPARAAAAGSGHAPVAFSRSASRPAAGCIRSRPAT